MSIARRTSSVARQGVKVHRRVVFAQALFWPALLGAGLAVGVLALAIRRSTTRNESSPPSAMPPTVR